MNTAPNLTASVEITPSFHDCDPMGVVWHGHYFKYFERVREVLFSHVDYGYKKMQESGFMFPVIDTRVRYKHAITVEQTVVITAQIVEYENRLKINYTIKDKATQTVLTTGYTVQVTVKADTHELQFVTPSVLLQKLGV